METLSPLFSLSKEAQVLIMSAVPAVELRGAIPLGRVLGMSPWMTYILAVLGSTLPAPFLVAFFQKILTRMKEKQMFSKLTDFLHDHVKKRSKSLKSATFLGLFLFVAIPLPMTGAYTGSMIASMLNLRLKNAVLAIFFGNMTAGIIMTALSYAII